MHKNDILWLAEEINRIMNKLSDLRIEAEDILDGSIEEKHLVVNYIHTAKSPLTLAYRKLYDLLVDKSAE